MFRETWSSIDWKEAGIGLGILLPILLVEGWVLTGDLYETLMLIFFAGVVWPLAATVPVLLPVAVGGGFLLVGTVMLALIRRLLRDAS